MTLLAQGSVKKGSSSSTKPTSQPAPQKKSANTNTFPEPPPLKKDEYAIFIEDKYHIFKTKEFEKIELTEGCLKSATPKCQAYEFAQIKPKNLSVKYPGFNNFSAIHCDAVGGKNLLALDDKNNHYNFCRFDDGSMANSWSMYYKHFPAKQTK